MWQYTIVYFIAFADTSNLVNSECSGQELNDRFLKTAHRSNLLNENFIFKGVYDAIIGELHTYYDRESLTVNISQVSPHSFFAGKTYVSIEVSDDSGSEIYERIVQGITTLSYHEVPMKEGYIITIFHLEAPTRFLSEDDIIDRDTNSTTNRFLVTRYGLKNLGLGNDPLYGFLKKLDAHVTDLQGSLESNDARHLLVGIRSLPQPYRTQYVIKHNSVMSECTMQIIAGSLGDTSAQGSLDVSTKQDINHLIGTMVHIKIGQEVVVEDIIQANTNMFRYVNVPYGVYSVEFTGPSVEDYMINPKYIEVKENVNPIHFDFEKININMLMNDLPLDQQIYLIDKKASEIASSSFRSSISFYLSDEKKLLLAAVRSLPETHRGHYLTKYSALISLNGVIDGTHGIVNTVGSGKSGTFTISVTSENADGLIGRVIRVENEHISQDQRVQGDVVTFSYLPYGDYTIKIL